METVLVEVKIDYMYNQDQEAFGRVFTTRGETTSIELLVVEHIVGREQRDWHGDVWDQIRWDSGADKFDATVGALTGAFQVATFHWRWSDSEQVFDMLAVVGESGLDLPEWFFEESFDGATRVIVS